MTLHVELETDRLRLQPPSPAQAAAVLDFHQRNQAHFARWDPPRDARFHSIEGQAQRLQAACDEIAAGRQLGWWLFARDDPGRPIGSINLTQITRGAFHNAMLGYALDAEAEGQGLMSEALGAVIRAAFGPLIHLHRLQANVRPENLRSLALLDRLGFQREGLARHYLLIDGDWRDHVMTALINPDWRVGWR